MLLFARPAAAVLCCLLSAAAFASGRARADAPAVPTPVQIVAAAPAAAWHAVPPDQLLVIDTAGGKRLLIQLAPDFAPAHVRNVQVLARGHWWDGAAILRVQDDYVAQWSQLPERAPTLPGFAAQPPAEYERPLAGLDFSPLPYPDSYATKVGFAGGWPVGTDGRTAWLTHCYGMVGVGRDLPPRTGDGSELYVVIGQAPRQLDRNLALVGRVVGGMEWLAALPRGQPPLGFYSDARDRVPIGAARLAADVPAADRPSVEVMDQASPSFAEWLRTKANRRDVFFVRPANGLGVCDAIVPSRILAPGQTAAAATPGTGGGR